MSLGNEPRRVAAARVLAIAQRVFLAVALGFIFLYFAANWREVGVLLSSTSLFGLLSAACAVALLHPLVVAAYWNIQRALGIEKTYRSTLAIHFLRLPARYVPGGIWHSLARYGDIAIDSGSTSSPMVRLFLFEAAATATGAALATGSLWLLSDIRLPVMPHLPYGLLAAGLLGYLFAGRAIVLRRGRKELGRWTIACLCLTLLWVTSGLAFSIVAYAIGSDFSQCTLTALTTTYTTAAAAGYLAIFSPQGWGVTEAIFSLIGPCGISTFVAVSTVLSFRLVTALSDIGMFLVFTLGAKICAGHVIKRAMH